MIAGNVIGYGATQGTMFLRGVVGERFFVRNSGATAVVEGVGDHALEYMTGGLAVILGATGRNLGAGMSGGTAYIYRLDSKLVNREALATGELELGELGSGDAEILRDLLEQHKAETDSTLAASLLENFDDELDELRPRHAARLRGRPADPPGGGRRGARPRRRRRLDPHPGGDRWLTRRASSR